MLLPTNIRLMDKPHDPELHRILHDVSADEIADSELLASEAVAAAGGDPVNLSAAEWAAAMERRLRVLQSRFPMIASWADDRPEEAAQVMADVRREITVTKQRLDHYRMQLRGLN